MAEQGQSARKQPVQISRQTAVRLDGCTATDLRNAERIQLRACERELNRARSNSVRKARAKRAVANATQGRIVMLFYRFLGDALEAKRWGRKRFFPKLADNLPVPCVADLKDEELNAAWHAAVDRVREETQRVDTQAS